MIMKTFSVLTLFLAFFLTAHAAPVDQAAINAEYVRTRDQNAVMKACATADRTSECERAALAARSDALKAKQVDPATCTEYGIATGYNSNLIDPMAASFEPSKTPGPFWGEIQAIDGKNIIIFNPQTLTNALVDASSAKIFGGHAIRVGQRLNGFGVQTGQQQGRRANGATTTIALVAAKCAGTI